MTPETCLIDFIEEIIVILGEHPVRLYNELLARRIHLNLRLLPISFRDREFCALVRLDFVDYIVLAVDVYSKPHTVFADALDPYLTVTAFDSEMIKDAMLISRTRRRVLI